MKQDKIIDALDAAFTARIGLLYTTLCDNLTDESGGTLGAPSGSSIGRFKKGFDIALRAHTEALAKLGGMP